MANWHNVITIIATIATTAIALGGVLFALMRGFFVTTTSCNSAQAKCQIGICKKIDELKLEIKEDRKIAGEHYAEIRESLGIITGKLNG